MESDMVKLVIAFISALLFCACLLGGLYYFLPTNFLAAQKNARSNHILPARQIGGVALIPAVLILLGLFHQETGLNIQSVLLLEASGWLLWLTGLLDDRFDISVRLRLIVQLMGAVLGIAALGHAFQLFTFLPSWLEFGLLVFVMLIWINMANFMDGLDLMTVSGLGVPVLWVAVFASLGLTGMEAGYLAALLAGAIAGFALFNRHPAKVFLGDSGSLPLGLLSGYILLLFAQETSVWFALILPLYYVLDASSTIILRLWQGENIFQAHSRHAYQIAKRGGYSVWMIVGLVLALNIVLGAGVLLWLMKPELWIELTIILVALLFTCALLYKFRAK